MMARGTCFLVATHLLKEDIGKEIDGYQYLPPNIAEVINKLEEEE